jgi:hypothetical protein
VIALILRIERKKKEKNIAIRNKKPVRRRRR